MAPKVKKEAPALPKAEAKVKTLKAKKSVPKDNCSQKKICMSSSFWAQDTAATEAAQILLEEHSQKKQD
jgi:hypothetical protein